MVDQSIDALLEAVRGLTEEAIYTIEIADEEVWDVERRLIRLHEIRDRLDALIKLRRGRPDDQPAK